LAGSSTRIPVVLILSLIFAWGTGSSGAQRRVDIGTALDGKMLPDEEVATFKTADRLYPSNLVARGCFVRALPVSTRQLGDITFQVGDKIYDLFDYLALNRVAGLLVLKDSKVALEDYQLGAGSRRLHRAANSPYANGGEQTQPWLGAPLWSEGQLRIREVRNRKRIGAPRLRTGRRQDRRYEAHRIGRSCG